MKTKKLFGGGIGKRLSRFAVPATTAAGMAVSDDPTPSDVAQGAMGLGSKFLTKLGGGLGMLLHSPGLNEGEDDPDSPYQKARMKAINENRVKQGKAPVAYYARGGGIESRGKTKGRFV